MRLKSGFASEDGYKPPFRIPESGQLIVGVHDETSTVVTIVRL